MKNDERIKYLSSIDRTRSIETQVEILDQLLYMDFYEYYCDHEFGIRKKDNGFRSRCMCLDCGNSYSEGTYQNLYDIGHDHSLKDIRDAYLKLLLDHNSQESIDALKEDKGISFVKRRGELL